MHNYILVCMSSEVDASVTPAALNAGRWPLYLHTKHRSDFRPGDRVVIYVGGQQEGSKLFVASAEVVSYELVTAVARRNVAPNVAEGNQLAVGWLQLGTVKEFSTPVPILELLDRLSFIPENRARWGVALVGGVRRIDDRDWDLILSEAAGASKSSDV